MHRLLISFIMAFLAGFAASTLMPISEAQSYSTQTVESPPFTGLVIRYSLGYYAEVTNKNTSTTVVAADTSSGIAELFVLTTITTTETVTESITETTTETVTETATYTTIMVTTVVSGTTYTYTRTVPVGPTSVGIDESGKRLTVMLAVAGLLAAMLGALLARGGR